MSKYTIELRKVCDLYTRDVVENWFKDYSLSDFITEEQTKVIGLAGIWSKDKLATKIVDHYYMREIGFETPALFKHYVKITMNEIMDKYAQLLYSASIQYDPLINVDYTETFERNIDSTLENKGSSNSSSNTKTNSLSTSSDTPQTNIKKSDVMNGGYVSTVGHSENSATATDKTDTSNNGKNNTLENYSKNVKGNSGVSATAQKMIEQYRQNIIDIDSKIIQDLNELFMGLF